MRRERDTQGLEVIVLLLRKGNGLGLCCHQALHAVCVIHVHMYVYMYVKPRKKIQHPRLASPEKCDSNLTGWASPDIPTRGLGPKSYLR